MGLPPPPSLFVRKRVLLDMPVMGRLCTSRSRSHPSHHVPVLEVERATGVSLPGPWGGHGADCTTLSNPAAPERVNLC